MLARTWGAGVFLTTGGTQTDAATPGSNLAALTDLQNVCVLNDLITLLPRTHPTEYQDVLGTSVGEWDGRDDLTF